MSSEKKERKMRGKTDKEERKMRGKAEKRHIAAVVACICLLGCLGFAQPQAEKRPAEKRGEPVGTIGEGVYTKPVWRRFGRGTYVGGYMDHELVVEQGKTSMFRAHRLIPFFYADVAPRIRFATEIEFE